MKKTQLMLLNKKKYSSYILYQLRCNACDNTYWIKNTSFDSKWKRHFCCHSCYKTSFVTKEKKCSLCGKGFQYNTLFCHRHSKNIKSWIDSDDGTNALLWVKRYNYKDLIIDELKKHILLNTTYE
jgi:transposase-like protein